MQFTIDNKISSFSESGFLVKTTKKIIDEISQKEVMQPISSGKKDYSINLDTDKLGDVETKITPFIIVEGKKIYGAESLIVNYLVEDTMTTDTSVDGVDVPSSKVKISPIVFVIGGAVLFLIILAILIISIKPKKRRK